jgi:hypothetical protein
VLVAVRNAPSFICQLDARPIGGSGHCRVAVSA